LGNASMEIPMAGGHMQMPNFLAAMPGATALTTALMTNMLKKKGVASIQELRDLAVEADVHMIACQMTMDLFEYKREDMIDGLTIGGAASWVEAATKCDINLYI
jgi:peroxiredoxin family protein